MSTALVLGGGLAGLLAAAALAPHARQVTVIEQGNLPDGPEPRREVPQGHFGHILLGGGADALDSLLPGTVDALRAAGAHHRQIPSGLLMRLGTGWLPDHDSTTFLIACSRHLLDHVVRERMSGLAVAVRTRTSVLGLLGDAGRVDGVLVENRDGTRETLPADLVVDATGRHSRAPEWLRALGSEEVREERSTPDSLTPHGSSTRQAATTASRSSASSPSPAAVYPDAAPRSSPSRAAAGSSPSPAPAAVNPPGARPVSKRSSALWNTRWFTVWSAPPARSARSAPAAAPSIAAASTRTVPRPGSRRSVTRWPR
ncbi:FAD-binding protein [Streptomyces sp. NPDC088183]|uniref:FAD-binding protein n=1 Tax=Streptomyces sp. NPDC088183 TaxID=3160992 RepID=UPI00343EE044